jgi:Asp-tRNA(Asn)/Glu-tRNA(Gln) amidotransferase A subunit family amidase
VAVAANLSTVAIAEETGVSIRNPCANANIACIAPTQGLVSRDGVIPISFTQDRLGQYGKTLEDAARVLDAIAGFDPKDPVTANSVGRTPLFGYAVHARPIRLRGKRLGVVREFMSVAGPSDEESVALAEAALADLAALGATLVDPLPVDAAMGELLPVLNPAYFPNPAWDFPCDSETVLAGDCPNPGFARVVGSARTNSYEFAFAFDRYLLGRGDPLVPDLDAFIATGPFFSDGFRNGLVNDGARSTLNDPEYLERLLRRKTIGEVVLKLMADFDLDALVFPMKTQPAGKIGAPGNSSGQILSSSSGLPSVLIPIGFTEHVVDRISGGGTLLTPAALPVALEFLGRPFSETTLIGIAATFEAATRHRQPSPFAPPLP